MRRPAVRRRAGQEADGARDPLRQKMRATSRAPGSRARGDEQMDGEQLDQRNDERLDDQIDDRLDGQLDARLDDRLDARLDARVDSRLDARLDARLDGSDAENWPRYKPLPAPHYGLPALEAARPTADGEEARVGQKKVQEPPATNRDAAPVPDVPKPVDTAGPLVPPPTPAPAATPKPAPAPEPLEKAEAKLDAASGKDAAGAKDRPGDKKDAAAKGAAAKKDPPGAKKAKGGKDADKPAGKKPDKGAAGKGANKKGMEDEEESEQEDAIEPDPLPPEESTALEVPLQVDVPTLEAEWDAPASMAPDAIPEKPRMNAAGEQNAKNGKPEEKSKAAADAIAHTSARNQAFRAYADLTQAAHGKQQAFVGQVSTVSNYMAHAYGMTAGEITHEHDAATQSIDAEAERQCTAIETNTVSAELDLQAAHDAGLKSLRRAAGSAHGTINANDKATTALISKNVGTLKDGHDGKFGKETKASGEAVDKAKKALQKWWDERETIYPIQTKPLQGAKHEKYQPRVASIAAAKIKEITDQGTELIKAWTKTSESSKCTVGCSYDFELNKARTKTFDGARKAVSKAFNSAKKGLAKQLEQGLLNLRRLRQASLTQVRNQQRTSRNTLTSQARATLSGARRAATGAIGGVQGAARGAMPGYWRALGGFEQSIKLAAGGGPPALTKAAQSAATPILRGLDNTSASLRLRLSENQQKLVNDHGEQQAGLREQRSQHMTAANEAFAKAPESFAQQASDALTKFKENADQLATSVSDAAQSVASKPEKLFAESFEGSRANAQKSLDDIFKTPGKKTDEDSKDSKKEGKDDGPKPDCSGCADKSGGGKGDGSGGDSKGITEQREKQEKDLEPFSDPEKQYKPQLMKLDEGVIKKVSNADINATNALDAGLIDKVAEEKVTGALRALTKVSGHAVDQRDYPGAAKKPTLSEDMRKAMGEKDKSYQSAIHYLNGETKEGAKLELEDSQHWYNDQEDRIEETMRAVPPDVAAAIGEDKELYERIHGALDGTDAKVFEALAKCDPTKGGAAEADALRMRDKVDKAKLEGEHDDVHKAEKQYTVMRGDDWNTRQLADMDPDQRKAAEDAHRLAVAAALGKIVTEEDPAKKAALADKTDAEKKTAYTNAAVDYVTRDVNLAFGEGDPYEVKNAKPGDPGVYTIKMEGANRDLAAALLLNGKDSAEARSAAVGVEIQRKDDGKAGNVDEAMFDDRFIRLLDTEEDLKKMTPQERKARDDELAAARDLRAKTLLMASEKYAGGKAPPKDYKTDGTKSLEKDPDPHVRDAQDRLVAALGEKFKDDKVGKEFVTNLIKEERPSPKTASLAMRYAMYSHVGTDEELMKRYPARMTRDEIKEMKKEFKAAEHKDFDEEAGLYGKGTFAELSGDDALEMERSMLGIARTEQEKAEAAAFAMYQQRRETGSFGQWLAKGSYGEAVLDNTQAALFESMGVTQEDFNPDGTLKPGVAQRSFNSKGEYVGKNRDKFLVGVTTGQLAAESYQAVIDKYASIATTGIAILGAIAAAVITVVTGGAAGPLIIAAVVTGLASMAANYAIKGGRYGWEQAAIDLGMTAVQAVTAGVGAGLGKAAQIAGKAAQAANAASKTLVTLAKLFTGNPVVDQIIIGAVTGAIGGVAGAAFDEKTWEKGGGDAVGKLFGGLIKGAMSGAATAAFTQSLEALGRNGATIADKAKQIAAQGGLLRGAVGLGGRGLGAIGNALGKGLNASTGGGVGKSLLAMGQRGLARSAISGISAMAGRSTELIFDKATGKFHGRLEDAFSEIGSAGLHAAIQGFGEGAGEAVGQGIHNKKVAAVAKSINEERVANNKAPFEGSPHDPNTPLGKAAEDLMFLNQHGKNGGDGMGRALNMEHIITHGGLEHTVATQHPNAAETDSMRAELMKHVPESLHGDFADVPIRVLSETEYKALTRSESGPVVTLIENGKPVVVIRAGAELSHLANEGPHLLQTADAATKPKVAKLDESVLAHWDKLDVDTQVDLYKNKIELEIDAHQRIADALEAKVARGDGDPMKLALDQARNEQTLANLRTRHEEVSNITPSQRAAMQNGEMPKPQYLEQPARLFSKKSKGPKMTPEEEREFDIASSYVEHISDRRKTAPRGGLVEDEMQNLPVREKQHKQRGDRRPEDPSVPAAVTRHDREVARAQFGKMLQEAMLGVIPHNNLTIASMEHLSDKQLRYVLRHGELPKGVEFHHVLTVKEFPEFARMAEAGFAMQTRDHRDAGHGMDTTRPLEAATLQDPAALTRPPFHDDPQAQKFNRAKRDEIAAGTRSTGDIDRDLAIDFNRRVRAAAEEVRQAERRADDRPSARNAQARDEARANLATAQRNLELINTRIAQHAEMQTSLLRHIPPELHAQFADVEIRVMSPREYARLTRSEKGPVVTLIENGRPIVVVREGTPPARVADEGPHVIQASEKGTRDRVARLDETQLKNWDHLDLDTQIDLYKTKIALEIDAHQRIQKSLEAELGTTKNPQELKAEIDRNEATLSNLAKRQTEVEDISPAKREAIRSKQEDKPDYLNQPARLFSKDPKGQIVFEPFVGPELKSPRELQERYQGARVIAAEQSEGRIPSAKDIAEFEAGGGRFIADRFGESLPDNSVDTMHVRYPLPHEKAQEMTLSTTGKSYAEIVAEANAHQAAVESVTNLAPHALRTLRPGGEVEIVFHEGSIESEINRACQREWTDDRTGRRYRLEPTGEPRTVQRGEIAPHSGHGIPKNVTEVQVVTLRKVLIPRTPEEIAAIDAARLARKQEKRRAREEEGQSKAERAEAARQRSAAREERKLQLDAETAQRVQDLQEGKVTLDEDLRQRLEKVAGHLEMDVDQLATVIRKFEERFGGHGRRYDAQDVIDSLRSRTRDNRAPRYGDLDGLIHEMALELNIIAVQQLREQIVAVKPNVVLGVERGGAFLAEVLARGVADFPEAKAIPKHVEEREGQEPAVRRTPHLETEIRRRIEELGQRRFAIVDFYMGGVFAEELHVMIKAIVKDHPYVEFEVMWMQEAFGFERTVVRPTRADLEEGVAFVGRLEFEGGRLKVRMDSPGVTLPPLRGVDPDLPQLHVTRVPVDIVLGDDMPSVLANDSKAPVRIFDKQGRIVCVIPVGTPDPVTGVPIDNTRELVRRLMQGAFGDQSRSGGKP